MPSSMHRMFTSGFCFFVVSVLAAGLFLLGCLGDSGGDGDGEETGEFNCTSNYVIFCHMSIKSPVYNTSAISASSLVLPQTTL